jgi:hypothetical protein
MIADGSGEITSSVAFVIKTLLGPAGSYRASPFAGAYKTLIAISPETKQLTCSIGAKPQINPLAKRRTNAVNALPESFSLRQVK